MSGYHSWKSLGVVMAGAAGLLLTGCATHKSAYSATPSTQQTLVSAQDQKPPRIVSKQKNILIAEPRNFACDGEKEFAFNVVFANRQAYPIDLAPKDFEIHYDNRTFPAMAEKDVEKDIHSGDWLKNSLLFIGTAGAIAGAAGGDLSGAQSLLIQTATDYSTLDNEQNAELEKYRNKVLKAGTIAPHTVYGGLIVARTDTDGKAYTFNSDSKFSSIDLVLQVDGEEQTLSFNCGGTP